MKIWILILWLTPSSGESAAIQTIEMADRQECMVAAAQFRAASLRGWTMNGAICIQATKP